MNTHRTTTLATALLSAIALTSVTRADDVDVSNSTALRNALRSAQPGTRILIAPGTYRGGLDVRGVHGSRTKPIEIRGADARRPPTFEGGSQALHLIDSSWVTIAAIEVRGFPMNGINIDDGGDYSTPAHHVVVEDVAFRDIGPRGNHDALKLSGLDDFTVRRCRFEGWGGSAIDMVGCHRGLIDECSFKGKDGFSQSNAVQIKGGSRDVRVTRCFFDDAGQRAINLGGSTGTPYFRPLGTSYEASRVEIAGNRFVGSLAPIAWVTCDGGHVHHNTIVRPRKWVLRILQETKDKRFRPAHDGVFEHNLVVFDKRVGVFVNVGAGTAPETFRFRHNAWFDLDGNRRPRLPTPETDGVVGVDPRLQNPNTAEMRPGSRDRRLRDVGATAFRPSTRQRAKAGK